MALIVTTASPGIEAEAPQPSTVNNRLYLHYNMTQDEGWMNTDPNDTNDTGWRNIYGLFQETRRDLDFPMKPSLYNNNSLVLNATRPWVIGVCLLSDRPTEVNGQLRIDGVYQCARILVADGNGWFYMEYEVGLGFVDYRWNLTFNISFMMHSGDFIAPYYKLETNGHSNLTIPINATEPDTDNDGSPDSVDPDDDDDGHNDTGDAYPLDPTKWEEPPPAKGFLPGFDALAMVVALGILAASFTRRKRRLQRFR